MQNGALKLVQVMLAGVAMWAGSAGMLLLGPNALAQNTTAPFTLTDDRGRVVVVEKHHNVSSPCCLPWAKLCVNSKPAICWWVLTDTATGQSV